MKTMIENRLRKLEAARPASVPVYVWGSSEAEWTARKQEILAGGQARGGDDFVCEYADDVKQTGAA